MANEQERLDKALEQTNTAIRSHGKSMLDLLETIKKQVALGDSEAIMAGLLTSLLIVETQRLEESGKRLEKLTWVLLFFTFVLAVFTALLAKDVLTDLWLLVF